MFEVAVEVAAEASGGAGSMLTMLAPFVLMFGVFYFLLIRPQQKKQKARNSMLREIQKGDKVVTIGGMHGTIVEVSDDVVVLKVNDATKLTFDRSSVNAVTRNEALASKEK